MSEWNDYFEDFPEENPANQKKPRGLPPVRREATDEPGGGGNEQANSTRGTRPLPAIHPPGVSCQHSGG